jgi:two-component system KDP operon response regulator KdpE
MVTYDELLEAVWNCPPGQGDPKWVVRCMSRLRKKLGEDAGNPKYVVNVPGVGYRLRSQQQW